MRDEQIEKRRRRVQVLRSKGHTQQEVADKLGVHVQTIVKDEQEINARYRKLVSENPNYLQRQLEKVFQFIDKLAIFEKEYWKLFEDSDTSVAEKRKLMDSIRETALDRARIVKLLGNQATYLQKNYIHIDQINQKIEPLITHMIYVIQKFVSEDKQKAALELLNNYEIIDVKGE